MNLNTPIPQDKIEESFVWRDWFQRLSNKVFGNMADQNSNDVSITGGSIKVDSLAVTGGKDGQLLIGRTSDHKFVPSYLTAGTGVSIATGPSTITISQSSTTTKSYGSFYDTTTQTAVALTVTSIKFNSTDLSSNVSIGSPTSRIVVSKAGTYNIQFSAQISNPASQIDDVTIWIRQNGVNLTNSAGIVGTPAKHGGVNGHTIIGWNYILQAAANDYFELYWITDSGTTKILTYPASATSPIHPQAPSMILTVQQL
jgi:hypothetical protein